MEYFTKVDIIGKISKAIKLHAEINRVKKYLTRKILLDNTTLSYEILFLDEDKMFEHSREFKTLKRLLIDRRGNRKSEYYISCDKWLNVRHEAYVKFKFLAFKLINRNDEFVPEDLKELNRIYKEVKRMKDVRKKGRYVF